MKKINLLKSLVILGAVSLTSVCVVETALLIHKNSGPENSDPVNLNLYNNYTLAVRLTGIYDPSDAEIKDSLVKDGIKYGPSGNVIHPITDKNDINVIVDSLHHQFIVSAVPNSTSYVADSSAIISYALPEPVELSSIIGTEPVAYVDDSYDQEVTKANVLKSLQTQYEGLNINHLNVTLNGYADRGEATITPKTNSELYNGNGVGATYFTSGSVSMTADKYVIAGVTSNNTATFTFNFRGAAASGVVYTATSLPSGILTLSSNVLTYNTASATDFLGGAYAIQGSYTFESNTYISRVVVFAQPNIQTGTLTISKPNVRIGNLNSGTTTMKVNGTAVSGSNLTYACDYNGTAITTANAEGISFNTTTGVLSWANNAPTYGGAYTITGTYSGTGIKTAIASSIVYVTKATDATLTVANYKISAAALNSGTPTLSVNGVTKTATSWSVSSGLTSSANSEGMSFANGIITYNGTSSTNGGNYVITATYLSGSGGVSVSASATVSVTPVGMPASVHAYYNIASSGSATNAYTKMFRATFSYSGMLSMRLMISNDNINPGGSRYLVGDVSVKRHGGDAASTYDFSYVGYDNFGGTNTLFALGVMQVGHFGNQQDLVDIWVLFGAMAYVQMTLEATAVTGAVIATDNSTLQAVSGNTQVYTQRTSTTTSPGTFISFKNVWTPA